MAKKDTQKPTTDPTIAELLTVRQQREQLLDRRQMLETAPLPLDEIQDRIDRHIEQLQHEAGLHVNIAPFVHPASNPSTFTLPDGERYLGHLIAWLLADVLRERLAKMAEKALQVCAPGPPAAERLAIIAKINAELLEVERREEVIVSELEVQGADVWRRPDADLDMVLEIAE